MYGLSDFSTAQRCSGPWAKFRCYFFFSGIAPELRMVFTFLRGFKESKEEYYSMTLGNHIISKFPCLDRVLLAPSCLCTDCLWLSSLWAAKLKILTFWSFTEKSLKKKKKERKKERKKLIDPWSRFSASWNSRNSDQTSQILKSWGSKSLEYYNLRNSPRT